MKLTNKKKIGLFVLIFTLTVSFVAGCQSDNPSANTKETTVTDNTDVTDMNYAANYLPDADYGGYEFRIVTPPNGSYNLMSLEADVEEETGDILYDAIYRRNRIIEERYNILFKSIVVDNFNVCLQRFQKSSQSGSDDFDMCMLLPQSAWSQALEGNILLVNNLPYLDITQPWYVHGVNSELSIGGKHFYVYSDECLNLFELSYCVLFNKKLTGDMGLVDIYNLVKENKWTMEVFFGYARSATIDIDGDGVMTEHDQYGILGLPSTVYPPLWGAGGVSLVGKDKDDYHVFTGENARVYAVMEKIYENLCTGEKIYFDGIFDKSTRFGNEPVFVPINQFAGNYGLFYVDAVSVVPLLRAMETDFGILPNPKYNEAQERYYTSSGKGWINCVSVSATDPERTSVIMESLAVGSKNFTIPAYIEVALRTKYSRDNESLEMLDIIEKTRTVDMGFSIYWDSIGSPYTYAFIDKDKNFASLVEKNIGVISREIDKSNEAARNLE